MNKIDVVLNLENLVATRDQLAKALDEARNQMARLKSSVSTMEERLQLVSRLIEVEERTEAELAPPALGERFEWSAPPNTQTVRSFDDQLETEVERILESAGRPLHISEIRSELIQNGVPIPGRGDDARKPLKSSDTSAALAK